MSQDSYFVVGTNLVNYLQSIGFKKREADSEKSYFVNKKGNQIRIDYDTGEIALLDNKGRLKDTYLQISVSTL